MIGAKSLCVLVAVKVKTKKAHVRYSEKCHKNYHIF